METARALLARIERPGDVAEETVLSTEPVIRASCGCPFDPATGFVPSASELGLHKEGLLIHDQLTT
jgi:hypothetical protein